MAEKALLEKIMEILPSHLRELAQEHFKTSAIAARLLKGDGSDRKIYRIAPLSAPDQAVVGVYHEDLRENRDFITIAEKMSEAGISVPEIYKVHPTEMAYLQEYLGEETLAEAISRWQKQLGREDILSAYRKVLSGLVRIQRSLTPLLADFLENRVMSRADFVADLEYFQEDFIQRFGYEALCTDMVGEELYGFLVKGLADIPASVFVYRDFQARNFMWKEDQPWFIDFQSAYLGASYYDLASCLYGSRSGLREDEREALLHYYFQESGCDPDYEQFLTRFYLFVLIRRLRSLGSYGFLSEAKGKPGFFAAIHPTLKELIGLLGDNPQLKNFPHLLKMICKIEEDWRKNAV